MDLKPVAFMSYAHDDDRDGYLTRFRETLATELRMSIEEGFDIFQDKEHIHWGADWQKDIDSFIAEATFFIPIITPQFFTRRYCIYELRRFLERERELGRNDLILPVYYVSTPRIENTEKPATDERAELARMIASRHYEDWRDHKSDSFESRRVLGKLKQMAQRIRDLWYEVSLARDERLDETVAQEMARHIHNLRYGVSPGNLPALRTSFVGREQELLEIKRALAMTRILTLTGVGGSGKTRLALEVAKHLDATYPNGVWLVELASLSEGELVPRAVATVLGVRETLDLSPTEALEDFLRSRSVLLVLDNCEHLIEACAELVGTLLRSCPKLRVLATSRVPLNLSGEREYLVPSLSLPNPKRPPPPERLTHYEAVKLFIERAQEARSDFSVTNKDVPTIAEICARLDGLPLAIELAVARLKVLTPQNMLDRLSQRLKLLTRGARDLPERQRTLRATMEWSFALLEEGEKVLFARLSVFAGEHTLKAIEAICDAEGDLPAGALDGVGSLVDNSLLREKEALGGERRFYMLETVHEYAREKLDERGEAEELRRLHAQYFLSLAEEQLGTFKGGGGLEWFQYVEEEYDNFRAALSWAFNSDEVECGLRLAVALEPYWARSGQYDEGIRWLEVARTKDDRVSIAVRAKGLNAVGWLTQWQGDVGLAAEDAKVGLELAKKALADAATGPDLMNPQIREASSVANQLRLLLGFTAEVTAADQHKLEELERLFEESLKLSRKIGDKWTSAASLLHLGNVAVRQAKHKRAEKLYEECIAMCRESDYPDLLGDTLNNLGYTRLLQRDHQRATALFAEAIAVYQKQGYRSARLEFAVDNMGWAALMRKDWENARILYQESLRLCRDLGNKLVAAESLEGLACVAGKYGEAERSARLFGAAHFLFGEQNVPHSPAEQALRDTYPTDAKSRLGEEKWEDAFVEGTHMEFEEAVEYALSGNPPSPSSLPAAE